MTRDTLAFIGGGNMARSLIGGLVARGRAPDSIHVAEPQAALREALAKDFGVQVHEDAGSAARDAGTWVLAVKPQVMRGVCETLAPLAARNQPLVVSIAAGVTAGSIDAWLGGGQAVVRTMPNTPSLLGAGATGLYANPRVTPEGRALAESLMSAVGLAAWVSEESLMDAVTGVSGSGPAYVFLLSEALQAAGRAQGLDADTARALANQTLLGAARMLDETGEDAATLRQRVTSPGGTTQAALESFEADGFRDIVARAVAAATNRGRQLAAS